jgi:hypothetical protein
LSARGRRPDCRCLFASLHARWRACFSAAAARLLCLLVTPPRPPPPPRRADTLHRFCKKEHDWGWKKFMELSKVLDGFTVADTLVIKAQVGE